MAIPSAPNNFIVQQANGQVLATWDLSAGATSYVLQKSLDNITFTTVASPILNQYLDTAVTLGVAYYYKVASVNSSGTSVYTAVKGAVPSTTGEMSLGELRFRSQQKADFVNSQFVTTEEWNSYLNRSMLELYDLLVTTYEDYFVAPPITFSTDGTTFLYDLPNGVLTFQDQAGNNFVPKPIYKLMGVDLAVNTANNAYVTINKFNFIDRNRYLYPNSSSSIYGVFNMRYRLLGNQIEFIPTPSAGQKIRLWYIPRLTLLLKDTDVTDISISGWIEYVITRAAKYAKDKQEDDTSKLDEELLYLKKRIEESASNRDAGQPDTISNTRNGWGASNNGDFFQKGGW